MKKIRDGLRMVCLFIRLVFEMIKNYSSLNDDLKNNFHICKKICQKVVQSAKIQLTLCSPENLGNVEPFLLVSNHRCFFDVVFLLAAVEKPISFVAAKELFSYPILRKYLASIRCVMLDRSTKQLSKIKEDVANMKVALAGGNLVLFPEGECSYFSKQMRKFKKGGFVCVSELGAFIVPAFIQIREIHNIGRWMIPQGEVTVYFGKGFYPNEIADTRISGARLATYAQKKVAELQERAESGDKNIFCKNHTKM